MNKCTKYDNKKTVKEFYNDARELAGTTTLPDLDESNFLVIKRHAFVHKGLDDEGLEEAMIKLQNKLRGDVLSFFHQKLSKNVEKAGV